MFNRFTRSYNPGSREELNGFLSAGLQTLISSLSSGNTSLAQLESLCDWPPRARLGCHDLPCSQASRNATSFFSHSELSLKPSTRPLSLVGNVRCSVEEWGHQWFVLSKIIVVWETDIIIFIPEQDILMTTGMSRALRPGEVALFSTIPELWTGSYSCGRQVHIATTKWLSPDTTLESEEVSHSHR